MDYEKAYKESFEAAKGLHDAGNALTKKQMEIVFPELRESEDERMINKLIAHFKWDGDTRFTKEECDDAIAWLEKQKEHKPVEIHIDNPNVQKFKPDVKITTSDSSADGKELLYVSNKSYNIGFRDGVNSVKQEWSEEDENMAYFVNQFLEYHELSDPTAKSCKKWFNNRFKSLRNRVGKEFLQPHWKPSEEQMKALLGAEGISRASGYPDNAKVLASLYEHLKQDQHG